MLQRIPIELLNVVIDEVSKKDQKALSLVSHHLHETVKRALWQSVTIESLEEDRLDRIHVADIPAICFELAKALHFRSSFSYRDERRCPHDDYDREKVSFDFDDDDFDENSEDDDEDEPHFNRLSNRALSVLRKLQCNQLDSFSWDLGACIPSTILGSEGTVTRNQASLKSLHLTTNSTCHHYYEEENCEIDLSSFCHIQSLRWRAPNTDNMCALSDAILLNAGHLRELELDFINWPSLKDYLDGMDEDITEENYFTRDILGLRKSSPQPCFLHIHTLSLSHIPLGADLAQAANFATLESLKLRLCPNWDAFIQSVLDSKLSLRLRTLEIQDPHSSNGEFVLRDLLASFAGLENLCISEIGPVDAVGLWNLAARHRASLKRFAYQQRSIDTDATSPFFEEEHDLSDLAIFGHVKRKLREIPAENPLAQLSLEFIGLACRPKILKTVLLPFKWKPSLKVIHIRQSRSDVRRYGSWAKRERPLSAIFGATRVTGVEEDIDTEPGIGVNGIPQALIPFFPSGSSSENEASVSEIDVGERELKDERHQFQPEFRHFANWIFGPNGVPSVQLVVYGDFANDNRGRRTNIVLCRSLDEGVAFRSLCLYERNTQEALRPYLDELKACPAEPLLDGSFC